MIVSTVPANLATGVSPTAPIVFTFSEAMNTTATTAEFMDTTAYANLTAFSTTWSGGDTVLTYTPTAPLPANHMVYWMVTGMNATGTPLGGNTFGLFTPAAASTGCDPNATLLSFTVAKGWMYGQTTAGAPALNASSPYCFLACMSLPCPRDATNVSVQIPSGAMPNLLLSPIPGHLTLPDCGYTSQTGFEAAYPNGNYVFNVQAVNSNQPVTVNFPGTLTQPAAPHLTNFLAGQSINPAQPFVLAWDPLPGGTAADCVYVEIYGGVFNTPALGEPGALNGTATAVVIPAGTFQPNRQYSGCVSFYHYLLATNGTSHLSLVYRSSTTEFNLNTTSAAAGWSLVITNAGWMGGQGFAFEVSCTNGQPLVAECSTNLLPNQWQTWCLTNSPSQRVRFIDPRAATNKCLFYRVRTGY